jgi:hypothetical protein
MAGLLIKELMIRGDVQGGRVAAGGVGEGVDPGELEGKRRGG